MFYNSFAKSVIPSSDLWISNKIELKGKLNLLNGELLEQSVSKNDSLHEILQCNKIPSVFDLFIVEIVQELFRQLRQGGQKQKIDFDMPSQNAYCTR